MSAIGIVKLVIIHVIVIFVNNGILMGMVAPIEESEDLTIQTKSGLVRGAIGGRTAIQSKVFYTFNIPFAKPPVGKLRFEPPEELPVWSGILDATREAPVCVQNSEPVVGNEDCLYLKVYTTKLPGNIREKFPVMVWIHGGGFNMGSANFTESGPDFFLDEGIVVVGIQYRLGIFGFLTTGDLVVPGNNGLKDQVLALKWVKENIGKFAGNPDDITVMGQSAGAASVSYLIQTEHTDGLFHRAIMDSGVSLCIWSLSRDGPNITRTIADNLAINTNSSEIMIEELKSVDFKLLQNQCYSIGVLSYLARNPGQGLLFAPVIEPHHQGALITEKSHDLLNNDKYRPLPVLAGYNSLELSFEVPDYLRLFLLRFDFQPTSLIPLDMNVGDVVISEVATIVKWNYFGIEPIFSSNESLFEFLSDNQFVRPIQEYVHLISKRSTAYFYKFSYEGTLGGITDRLVPGVVHTEELGYLFNSESVGSIQDHLTRTRMVRMWTNFIKCGNPTPGEDIILQNKIWPEVSDEVDSITCMNIRADLVVETNPNYQKMDLWKKLYSAFGDPPYDTY